jgi:hypothetical protein
VKHFVDSPILVFDDDLEIETRAVLARTPEPQNAFEVAVILETLGYNDPVAQGLGTESLFDLGKSVFEVVKDFDPITRAPAAGEPSAPVPRVRQFLLRGVLCSVPWITAILILLTTGAGFWSVQVFTPMLAAGLTLALFAGLITSAPFVHAFTRRATFFALQGRPEMVRWTARRMLGSGAVACTGILVGGYFLLERTLDAYTPGTTRSFLEMGLAISGLQLAFAPLYALRAFGWLLTSVATGAAVLVIGLMWTGVGLFVDPFDIVHVQLASVVAMALVAAVGYWWRMGRTKGEHALTPRLGAVVRSVRVYALYGTGYFALIIVDQLVAGGIWHGRFVYDVVYETIVGAALVLVVPMFTYVIATSECFPKFLVARLSALSVADVGVLRSDCLAFQRRHARVLVVGGVVSAGLMLVIAELTAGHLPISTVLSRHIGLFSVALAGYVLLTLGMFDGQLLLSLSRPKAPSLAIMAGVIVSALVGGGMEVVIGAEMGAVSGLVCGTAVFAVGTAVPARRRFANLDASLYWAF